MPVLDRRRCAATARELDSTDPGAPARVVAQAAVATRRRGRRAPSPSPARRLRAWAAVAAAERAAILVRAAALLRERRLRLAALAVRECAKPWDQADADVCEAIDFLEYYARGAVALEDDAARLLQIAGRAQRDRLPPARRRAP